MFRAPNSPELFASLLGTLKIGAIAVPTQTLLGEREVEHIVNNSDVVLAFSDPERVGIIEAVRNKCPTLKHIVVLGKTELRLIHITMDVWGKFPSPTIHEAILEIHGLR